VKEQKGKTKISSADI